MGKMVNGVWHEELVDDYQGDSGWSLPAGYVDYYGGAGNTGSGAASNPQQPQNYGSVNTNGSNDDEDFDPEREAAATAAAEVAANRAWQEAQDQNIDERLAFDRMVQAATEAYNQQKLGLDALSLSASLRGPRNAFTQQAVMSGLNSQGYSNAIDAIAGRFSLPAFQAPQAQAQGASLATLAEDIRNSGQQQGSVDAALAGLPNLNKIIPREFLGLNQDTRDFVLSGFEQRGYSANDVIDTLKNLLPKFQAPVAGFVRT